MTEKKPIFSITFFGKTFSITGENKNTVQTVEKPVKVKDSYKPRRLKIKDIHMAIIRKYVRMRVQNNPALASRKIEESVSNFVEHSREALDAKERMIAAETEEEKLKAESELYASGQAARKEWEKAKVYNEESGNIDLKMAKEIIEEKKALFSPENFVTKEAVQTALEEEVQNIENTAQEQNEEQQLSDPVEDIIQKFGTAENTASVENVKAETNVEKYGVTESDESIEEAKEETQVEPVANEVLDEEEEISIGKEFDSIFDELMTKQTSEKEDDSIVMEVSLNPEPQKEEIAEEFVNHLEEEGSLPIVEAEEEVIEESMNPDKTDSEKSQISADSHAEHLGEGAEAEELRNVARGYTEIVQEELNDLQIEGQTNIFDALEQEVVDLAKAVENEDEKEKAVQEMTAENKSLKEQIAQQEEKYTSEMQEKDVKLAEKEEALKIAEEKAEKAEEAETKAKEQAKKAVAKQKEYKTTLSCITEEKVAVEQELASEKNKNEELEAINTKLEKSLASSNIENAKLKEELEKMKDKIDPIINSPAIKQIMDMYQTLQGVAPDTNNPAQEIEAEESSMGGKTR